MTSPYVVRLACFDDLDEIIKLFNSTKSRFIGDKLSYLKDFKILFNDYQAYRFVAVESAEDNQQIIAYGAFRDYPPLEALPSDCWLNWLRFHYCINLPITLLNTMFINFCIYNGEKPEILEALLLKIFSIELKMDYLIVVKQPISTSTYQKMHLTSYLTENFDDIEFYGELYFPKIFAVQSCSNTQSIIVIKSEKILPSILYRKALPEDNDDVVELLDNDMPELRQEYGDFYIAEALLYKDPNIRPKDYLIITEIENEKNMSFESAGFLWLTDDFDIGSYVRNYELDKFGNLVNFDRNEPYVVDDIPIIERQEKNSACLFTDIAVSELKENTILGGLQKCDSSISVASLSKIRVKSIDGTLYIDTESQYYEHESIFIKFQEIYQELRSVKYYVTTEPGRIFFTYNISGKPIEEASPHDTLNSFIIKYCCISPKYPVELVFKYLVAAFSAYPHRDYCLVIMPKIATPSRMMSEMLQYFMLVNERPSYTNLNENLYIVHRSIIQGELSVHELRWDDVIDIKKYTFKNEKLKADSNASFSFVSNINVHEDEDYELQTITDIMNDVLSNKCSEYTVLTIRCGNSSKSYEENTFVGFIALRRFENWHYLHNHYHLPWDDLQYNNRRCEIIMLKLHPFFHMWSNEIFRSIARKTTFIDFFYIRLLRVSPLSNDLAKNMMPIEPLTRKKVYLKFHQDFNVTKISGRYNLPTVEYNRDYLHIFRNTLLPIKFFGNKNSIVIIGFTDVCKAFLRQMIFQWNSKDHKNSNMYTCLTNIRVTVIVEPGIVEAEFDTKFVCPICHDSMNCYLKYQNESIYVRNTTCRIDLRNWVHFVPAFIESINRNDKCIRLRNSCDIHYDTLLIMCASKFAIKKDLTAKGDYVTPVNVEEINSRLDRILLLHKIKTLVDDIHDNFSILVYGSNLQTYECLNFLVTHGVSPKCITLVIPHISRTEEDRKMNLHYEDITIQYILEDMVSDIGIKVRDNLNFKHFLQFTTMRFVTAVVFSRYPSGELLKIYCDMFINFEDGAIAPWNKILLKNSGIAMKNDRIIVDENYCTNDSNIYAMGRNIYMPKHPNYQYIDTSPREAAEKLIRILKLKTDYQFPFEYKFAQPVYFQAQLPLEYFITKLTLPRRYLSNQLSDEHSCRLTTYHNGVFSRVHLNQHDIIDEIVCLTKSRKHLDFLEHLCGKHESMLNSLRARYSAGLIKCFFQFFQEPWTELIMHEDFENLQRENHELLRPLTVSIISELDQCPMTEMKVKKMKKYCTNILEQRVLEFLRQRRSTFVHPFALPEDFKR